MSVHGRAEGPKALRITHSVAGLLQPTRGTLSSPSLNDRPLQDVPATQEALAGAPDAVAPQDVVATTSTSTATLPQTPNGPQTRSLVQSIASRSSHRHASPGCCFSLEGTAAAMRFGRQRRECHQRVMESQLLPTPVPLFCSSVMNSKLMSQDVLLSYIAKQASRVWLCQCVACMPW